MTKDEALKMAIEALNEYPISLSQLIVALESCMDVLEQCDGCGMKYCECGERDD